MNTASSGLEISLMEELKATTRAAHARVQAQPYFEALAAGRLPLESYVGQLRALAMIHYVLEPALENCSHSAVKAVWRTEMRKAFLLEGDLQFFEARAVADLNEAVEEALRVVERIRVLSMEKPLALLGCWYVLEGSALGGALLRHQYAQNFLLEGNQGTAYVGSYAAGMVKRWDQFRHRMNGLLPTPREREQILDGAEVFFGGVEAIFKSLFPFRPESRNYLVTSINPEAGRHPVPTDPRELDAAVRAADLCWRQFPYLESRYGERGRRFARSDSAWLATLHQHEPARVCEQVRWLGRLLAARGMPTILLEVHLKMLFDELVAAIPEKRSEYEKLVIAAAELRTLRQKYLSDEWLCDLGKSFDRSVGAELSRQFPSAGSLLGAAVADETAGNEKAVESLRSWMCNSSIFPPEWIAAVDGTVTEARRLVRLVQA